MESTSQVLSSQPTMAEGQPPHNTKDTGTETDKGNGNGKGKMPKMEIPKEHIVPGTDFVVDFFRWRFYPMSGFLTHFHSDHYGSLSKTFQGRVYCSEITARMIRSQLGVPSKCIEVLDIGPEVEVGVAKDGTKVTVFLLPANHCPGAVMFLFKVNSRTILHTGDFRFTPSMLRIPSLALNPPQSVYLDTTFCDPKFVFPSQESIIEKTAKLIASEVKASKKTLCVIGSYTIGKEKLVLSSLRECNCNGVALKCYMNPRKALLYQLSGLMTDEVKKWTTTNPKLAQLHVVSMGLTTYKNIWTYLEPFLKSEDGEDVFDKIIGFAPTGWNHTPKRHFNRHRAYRPAEPAFKHTQIELVSVGYSEHSSFAELRSFISGIKPKPKEIIPTVPIAKPIDEYLGDIVDFTGNAGKIDHYLRSPTAPTIRRRGRESRDGFPSPSPSPSGTVGTGHAVEPTPAPAHIDASSASDSISMERMDVDEEGCDGDENGIDGVDGAVDIAGIAGDYREMRLQHYLYQQINNQRKRKENEKEKEKEKDKEITDDTKWKGKGKGKKKLKQLHVESHSQSKVLQEMPEPVSEPVPQVKGKKKEKKERLSASISSTSTSMLDGLDFSFLIEKNEMDDDFVD